MVRFSSSSWRYTGHVPGASETAREGTVLMENRNSTRRANRGKHRVDLLCVGSKHLKFVLHLASVTGISTAA